ncbi:MAG: precorrin-8X methylmutase [Proteobacteria bacterium]|nr:precorrin-8X methylmutase [Pseudomonadota bacterium]
MNLKAEKIIDKSENKTGVLLLGHGSRLQPANKPLKDVAKSIEQTGLYGSVEAAFLQLTKPDFQETVDLLASKGVDKIIVMPYFLYTGVHVRDDLPREIGEGHKKYPDIEFVLAPNLGFHPSLVDITMERLVEAQSKETEADSADVPGIHPIESESFSIIASEMDESAFLAEQLPIIKRVIHTTADFEFASLLKFSPCAIEAGLSAIREGANIITDVTMVKTGVSQARLKVFSKGKKNLHCFIGDKSVALESKSRGITRSAAAIRKGASFMDGAIVAIGNAPTALNELLSLIKSGAVKPRLVIGVPVGFVDAKESKDALMASGVEFISVAGRKGGSTVAVAIINALLIMAGDEFSREKAACE